MRPRLPLLALLALATRAAGASPGETLVVPPGWTMAWHDEFDVDGLPAPARWRNDQHHNATGWPNGEAQYYAAPRAENAVARDGRLLITARREALPTQPDWGGQSYTSARLTTQGLAEWTGGFFEVRARLPCGSGTWPAIWTLGSQGTWPANGELDLMEQSGPNPGRILTTVHTAAASGGHAVGAFVHLPDACTAFHRYQMLWTPDRIRFGIDGHEHLVYPRLALDGADAARAWPFDGPQYLLLNVAVGGTLGGPIDERRFPATMEVDYVRVWQPAPAQAASAPDAASAPPP